MYLSNRKEHDARSRNTSHHYLCLSHYVYIDKHIDLVPVDKPVQVKIAKAMCSIPMNTHQWLELYLENRTERKLSQLSFPYMPFFLHRLNSSLSVWVEAFTLLSRIECYLRKCFFLKQHKHVVIRCITCFHFLAFKHSKTLNKKKNCIL